MPEDLKLSQIGSSQLPPPFRGLHSPRVRKHCQIIFACYFQKLSITSVTVSFHFYVVSPKVFNNQTNSSLLFFSSHQTCTDFQGKPPFQAIDRKMMLKENCLSCFSYWGWGMFVIQTLQYQWLKQDDNNNNNSNVLLYMTCAICPK